LQRPVNNVSEDFAAAAPPSAAMKLRRPMPTMAFLRGNAVPFLCSTERIAPGWGGKTACCTAWPGNGARPDLPMENDPFGSCDSGAGKLPTPADATSRQRTTIAAGSPRASRNGRRPGPGGNLPLSERQWTLGLSNSPITPSRAQMGAAGRWQASCQHYSAKWAKAGSSLPLR
jgi:hypothetical protein